MFDDNYLLKEDANSIADGEMQARIIRLLDAGQDLRAKRDDDGNTLIHESAGAGLNHSIFLLHSQGLSLEEKNGKGWTPITCAVVKGRYDVAQNLIVLGVDPDPVDCDGQTPLMLAARNLNLQLVGLLLTQKTVPVRKDATGNTALDHARAALAAKKQKGRVTRNQKKVVEVLERWCQEQ